MPHEIRMPSLGQTTDEMIIIRWFKAQGDSVKLGEPLLEVETDKATLEVEAVVAGTVIEILHHEQETVQAGAIIAYVGLPGDPTNVEKAAAIPRTQATVPTPPIASSAPVSPSLAAGKVLAVPSARLLASENHIDIARIKGSGAGGLIEKRDVQAVIQQFTSPASDGDFAEIPVPRHRQIIAQRLSQSVATIPQIRLTMKIDMTQAQALMATQRNAGLNDITYTHLILRSVAHALRAHPNVNRLWLSEGPAFRQLARADVGLAVAGDDNLLVATIPEPDNKALNQLVRLTQDAVERCRRGVLSQADMAPVAISVSNLGMYSVDDFQAIVDPSQTAILGVGRVADQVVVIDGGIRVIPQMSLSLTIDHRVADGVLAAQFLNTIREALERGET